MEPLAALLRPGMKVTVVIDDISKPLPKMFSPDVRESVLNIILPLFAEKGIDDVQIIIATSFHRKMAPFEVRHAVGKKIFNAYYPHRLYDHDTEAPAWSAEGLSAKRWSCQGHAEQEKPSDTGLCDQGRRAARVPVPRRPREAVQRCGATRR